MIELLLIQEGIIIPAFVKANKFLIQNYLDKFSTDDRHLVLIQLWKEKFKASLHKDSDGFFSKVFFEEESDYAMFILKFS